MHPANPESLREDALVAAALALPDPPRRPLLHRAILATLAAMPPELLEQFAALSEGRDPVGSYFEEGRASIPTTR